MTCLMPVPALDEELIRRTALGDQVAFHTLVERHRPAVFQLLRLLSSTRQDAEDILQETFLAVYRYAGQFRGESSFRTWLFRIARNAAYQARVRNARQAECFGYLFTLGLHHGWTSDDPEQLAIRAQTRNTLRRMLAALDPEDREVIMLRDVSGLSGEDTARTLGISLAAMKSRLHRARMRLVAGLKNSPARRRTHIARRQAAAA